jgi:hypothetical protein
MTATELTTLQPNPAKRKWYDQGFSAFPFSELAAWKGYTEAAQIAQWIAQRELAPATCRLLTTYQKFLTALADEANAQKQNQ